MIEFIIPPNPYHPNVPRKVNKETLCQEYYENIGKTGSK